MLCLYVAVIIVIILQFVKRKYIQGLYEFVCVLKSLTTYPIIDLFAERNIQMQNTFIQQQYYERRWRCLSLK